MTININIDRYEKAHYIDYTKISGVLIATNRWYIDA